MATESKVVVKLATGLADTARADRVPRRDPATDRRKNVDARGLSEDDLVPNAGIGGATPLLDSIGDEPATVFSYGGPA